MLVEFNVLTLGNLHSFLKEGVPNFNGFEKMRSNLFMKEVTFLHYIKESCEEV